MHRMLPAISAPGSLFPGFKPDCMIFKSAKLRVTTPPDVIPDAPRLIIVSLLPYLGPSLRWMDLH